MFFASCANSASFILGSGNCSESPMTPPTAKMPAPGGSWPCYSLDLLDELLVPSVAAEPHPSNDFAHPSMILARNVPHNRSWVYDLEIPKVQGGEMAAVPEQNEELIKVFDTDQESEAMVVRGLLESQGIEALITNLDAPQDVLPGVGGVIVQVRADQADQARQVIEEFRSSAAEPDLAEESEPAE